MGSAARLAAQQGSHRAQDLAPGEAQQPSEPHPQHEQEP